MAPSRLVQEGNPPYGPQPLTGFARNTLLGQALRDEAWAAVGTGCWSTGYSSGNRWFVQSEHTEALLGVLRCAVTPAWPGKGRGAAQQRVGCYPCQPC